MQSHGNKMVNYHRATALQGALVLAKSGEWNWETIFYGHTELSQLIVQILATLHFLAPFGGLGTTYNIHLGLIGKHVMYFILV